MNFFKRTSVVNYTHSHTYIFLPERDLPTYKYSTNRVLKITRHFTLLKNKYFHYKIGNFHGLFSCRNIACFYSEGKMLKSKN